MTDSPNYAILYLKISVSQYIISYFILILFTVVWFGPILEKSILIVSLKCKKGAFELLIFLTYITHWSSVFWVKLLKVNDVFSLSKLLFIFNFIKENILEDLKRLFIFNKFVHSYETLSSHMFYIPEGKTSRFGLNTFKLWWC